MAYGDEVSDVTTGKYFSERLQILRNHRRMAHSDEVSDVTTGKYFSEPLHT